MSFPLPVVDGVRVQIFMGADSPHSFPSQRPTAEELMDLFFFSENQSAAPLFCFARDRSQRCGIFQDFLPGGGRPCHFAADLKSSCHLRI